MNAIPRIETAPASEMRTKTAAAFSGFECMARQSGNAPILMEFDRVPGLVLGAANRVSENAESASIDAAHAALSRIVADYQASQVSAS